MSDEVKKKLREMIQKDVDALTSKLARLGVNCLVFVDDGELRGVQVVHRKVDDEGKEGEIISEVVSLVMEGAKAVLDMKAAPIPASLALKLMPILEAIMVGGPEAIDALEVVEVRAAGEELSEVVQKIKQRERRRSAMDDLDDMLTGWGSNGPVKA